MSLKKNVFANYLGQGWRALMGIAFVPLYIKYLGIEAYGLIGIFAILQAWLALLDMGMTPALSREMARFTAGAHNAESIRDLLRSLEIIGSAIAATIVIGMFACSSLLASHWVKAEHLPTPVIAHAMSAMGVVTGLRFIENIYTSSIVGLQRQVLQNTVLSVMATARGLGAVAILAWVSPSIEAFFVWQCIISLVTIPVLGTLVYRRLPPGQRPAQFSWPAVLGVWRFAAGMLIITGLALLLTQVDKILLSRLLSLRDFGYYALAGVIASTLYMLAAPVSAAFYPRFTELATLRNEAPLQQAYHQAAQLITVVVGSAAVISIIFGARLLLLWTADPNLAGRVAPLLAVITAGTLLNALMGIPYQMQLAHGWTGLTIKVNIVAVAILIPAIFWIAPRYGVIGAAWVWVSLNAGYLIFAVYFMHRRILRQEKWRWYAYDLAVPMCAAIITALLCRLIIPSHSRKSLEIVALLGSALCVMTATAIAAPIVRQQLSIFLLTRFKSLYART